MKQIVQVWVKMISRAKGFNEEMVEEARANIYTFGSYRIGVELSFSWIFLKLNNISYHTLFVDCAVSVDQEFMGFLLTGAWPWR